MKTYASSMIFCALLFGSAASSYAVSVYEAAVQANGPRGYWRLGEANAATTATNSATATVGTLNGTYSPVKVDTPGLITSDPSNTAADFEFDTPAFVSGTGINTASPSSGNVFAGDWTIEAWFVRESQTTWGGIFSAVATGSYGAPLMTFIENSNQIGINGAGLTPNNVSVDLGASVNGKLVYAVITKTGGNADSTAALSVYVNLDGTWLTPATGTNSGWALATNSNDFQIGRHYDGGLYFDGKIDEVAIYSTALTETQIHNHYLAAVPEPTSCALLGMGTVTLLTASRRRRVARTRRDFTV